ncbi:MAG: hypothetical protein ACR2GN_08445 [Bacteroidia bacterium]
MKKNIPGHTIYLATDTHVVMVKVNIPEKPIGVTIMCDDQVQPEMVSRNELVSQILNKECFITMQIIKERSEACDGKIVLPAVLNWLEKESKYSYLPVTVFCSGRSAGNVLRASANADKRISAIAIRSGIINLSPEELKQVNVPVLFIAADHDIETANKIEEILPFLNISHNVKIISNATRYFTELGKLGHVVFLAVEWFRKNMINKAKTA